MKKKLECFDEGKSKPSIPGQPALLCLIKVNQARVSGISLYIHQKQCYYIFCIDPTERSVG